jgi:hypothetical protein
MIALLVLSALGPCADVAACTFKLRGPDELLAPAREAMRSLKLTEAEPKSAPAKLSPGATGDVAFSIELELAGESVVARALSLHRAPSVFGRAEVTPRVRRGGPYRDRALQVAVRASVQSAFADLSAQLLEAAGRGSRTLKLAVRVNGLDGPSRAAVTETFLPCLTRQFDQLGAVTVPREVAGYLEDAVEYVPAKDEPRESLRWQADRLRALTVGAKAACPPPAKWAAAFAVDTVNRGVVIELR